MSNNTHVMKTVASTFRISSHQPSAIRFQKELPAADAKKNCHLTTENLPSLHDLAANQVEAAAWRDRSPARSTVGRAAGFFNPEHAPANRQTGIASSQQFGCRPACFFYCACELPLSLAKWWRCSGPYGPDTPFLL
jgi:esterase/lipase superfamily enzyme